MRAPIEEPGLLPEPPPLTALAAIQLSDALRQTAKMSWKAPKCGPYRERDGEGVRVYATGGMVVDWAGVRMEGKEEEEAVLLDG